MIIKTCPHCGGESWLNESYSNKNRCYFAFVKCSVCGAQGKIYQSKKEPSAETCRLAVSAWNMRYGDGTDIEQD